MNMDARALRTLSIGGATYDLFLSLPAEVGGGNGHVTLPSGAKIRVAGIHEACGGGACNTSVGFARFGCHASFCGVIGSDQWGTTLLSTMQREAVDTRLTTVIEGETSSFSLILIHPDGERTILYHGGANEHLHDAIFDRDALLTVDGVYINHLCERGCMIEDDLIMMLTENERAHVSWNPGGCQIEAGISDESQAALLRRTDLLLLNKEEALRFSSATDVQTALRRIIEAGARRVCVTDGSRGAFGADKERVWFCPAVNEGPVVDATGAGDAFGTAVSFSLMRGQSLQEALVAGTLNASSVVRSVGAQTGLLTEKEIHSLIAQNRVQSSLVERTSLTSPPPHHVR